MLKCCLDCIAGYNDARGRTENDSYGIHLNGTGSGLNGVSELQQSPPPPPDWPTPAPGETMFLLPRAPRARDGKNDLITVSGRMNNEPRTCAVSLVTGQSLHEVALRMEARFPASGETSLTISLVHNGQMEVVNQDDGDIAYGFFHTEGTFNLDFTFSFRFKETISGHSVSVGVGTSTITTVHLKHDLQDIRYLTLDGDITHVDSLNFNYDIEDE